MGLMKILTDRKDIVSEDFITEDIEAVLSRYPDIERDTALKILAIDPTFKPEKNAAGTYGKWLLNLFNKGENVLEKEADVKNALASYENLKKRNKLQPEQKDINRFKSTDDLIKVVNDNAEAVAKNDIQIEAEKISPEDAKFIARSDTVEVWQPLTFKGAKALSHLGMPEGQYAAWCTNAGADGNQYGGGDNYWRQYTGSNGKLFIFTNIQHPREEKYQAHLDRDGKFSTFLDIHDHRNETFRNFIIKHNLYDKLFEIDDFKNSVTFRSWEMLDRLAAGQPFVYDGNRSLASSIDDMSYESGTDKDDIRNSIKFIKVADGVSKLKAGAFTVSGGLPNVVSLSIPAVENNSDGEGAAKYVTTEIGASTFSENIFPNPEFKIKTIRHKLDVKTSPGQIDFIKAHISWITPEANESLEESYLTETFSESTPAWLKDAFENSNLHCDLLRKALNRMNIDLSRAKFISGEIPTSNKDPRLKSPNIPFFRVKMYRYNDKDSWYSSYFNPAEMADEKNYIYQVYAKGINDDETFLLHGDNYFSRDNRTFKYASMKQLLLHCVDFCYLDSSDPDNFRNGIRFQRAQAHNNLPVNYNRGKGQYPNTRWDSTSDKYVKDGTWRQERGEDKSGYLVDPDKYKNMLVDKGIIKYNDKLDAVYEKLSKIKEDINKYFNKIDIKGETTIYDDVLDRGSDLMSSFEWCVNKYRALLARIAEASSEGDEVLKSALKSIFVGGGSWDKPIYDKLMGTLDKLQSELDQFSVETLESLQDTRDNKEFFNSFLG